MNKYLLLIALTFLFSCKPKSERVRTTVHAYPKITKYEVGEMSYWIYYEVSICNKRNMVVKELLKGGVDCKEPELPVTLQYLNHFVDSVAVEGSKLIEIKNK